METTIAQPIKKEKMAETKIGWVILNFLGIPAVLLSMFGNLAEPFKTAVSVLALMYGLVMTIRLIVSTLGTYEAYREKRISNNEYVRKLKLKHPHDHNQN